MSFLGNLAYQLGKGFSEGFWTAFFAERRRQEEHTHAKYDEDKSDAIINEFDRWLHPTQPPGSGDSQSPKTS